MDALLTPPWGKRRWKMTMEDQAEKVGKAIAEKMRKAADNLGEWIRQEIYRTGFRKMLEEAENHLEGLRMMWNNLDPEARVQRLRDIKNYLEMLADLEEDRAKRMGEWL
jgi:hypothetical protein